MHVGITEFVGEVTHVFADAIEAVLRRRPDVVVVVGVATDSSPVGTDDEHGRRDAARTISLARGLTFMFNESLASRTRIKTLTR